MVKPLVVSSSRAVPVALGETMGRVLPMPLETIFDRRFLALPPTKGTDLDQPGWDAVGDKRTIRLSDGGTLREELVRVDQPRAFGYVLTDVTGPMKPLASYVEGLFTFDEVGTGTRITWQWTVHPRTAASGLVFPVFARMWHGYARLGLERIEQNLLAAG